MEQPATGDRAERFEAGSIALAVEATHARLRRSLLGVSPGRDPKAPERHVQKIELFSAMVADVAVVWWEDKGQLSTAVSSNPMSRLDDFALLCVRGRGRSG